MDIKSFFVYPLLKSSLPLLVCGRYYLFKEILSNYSLLGSNLTFNYHDDRNQELLDSTVVSKSDGVISEEMLSLDFLNQVSFGIYTNFFAFLLVMFLIDIIWKIVQNGARGFLKDTKESIVSLMMVPKKSKKELRSFKGILENQMMIRIISYALIFFSLQIVGLGLSFTQNESFTGITENSQNEEKFSVQPQEDYFGLPRILSEDIQDNEVVSPLSDKISLSMGNILSSLNLNVNAMVLSKDRKIAYATLDFYGTLKIIDVSDLKSPVIMGSLSLSGSVFGFRIKSLALSLDQKTLYASNSRELEIINVTNPGSPKLISLTQSEIFGESLTGISDYFRTSLAVSERTKTLYIGGLGLQVYNVSNPKKPVLLKAVKDSTSQNGDFLRNEICLSRDGQVLFLANGTLDIYNVSNPQDMKLLSSFKTKSSPRSILLSENGKTAFLLGTSILKEVIFEEMDISNYGSLKVLNTALLGQKSINSPRFLTVSPSQSKFFIFANSRNSDDKTIINLLVFDSVKQTTVEIEKSLMEETFVMNFSPDGRSLLAGSNSQFLAIELSLDYPNSRIFSESLENQISNFSLSGGCTDLRISNDGKYLFILRKDENDSLSSQVFEIWNVSNSSAPQLLSSYKCNQVINQIHLSKNDATVYLLQDRSLIVLDISNKSLITETKTYDGQDKYEKILHFVTSSDEKTGFLLVSNGWSDTLIFLNLSSQSFAIEAIFTISQELRAFDSKPLLKDDKTLIVLDEEILIYDISNLHSPVKIASLPYGTNETKPEIGSFALSPDKQMLFIETSDWNYFNKLRIYNLSDVASPHFISEKYLSRHGAHIDKPEFSFPSNSNTGFLYQNNSFIKLNLADLRKPMISGIVPLKHGRVSKYTISADGHTIYTSVDNQIQILNVNIEYTFYLKQEKFMLGEKSSNKVSMLHRSGKSDYDLLDSKSYKLTKLSLLDIQIAPNKISLEKTTSPLPSWMTFESESNVLTIEPKKPSDIGTYTLNSAFSLKIPHSAFENLGTDVFSEDVISWLISLDYMDSDLFLTAKFKSLDTFYLPAIFKDYKTQIYNLLKEFHIETCTMFDVVSSLEFNENSLVVSSLSPNNIKAEITIEGSEVKFVNLPYGQLVPLVKENKSKVSLEGSIDEINAALGLIVVNSENGISSDASIVIKDGLNPPISMEILNISRYFRENQHPKLNNNADQTLQEQINHVDIQTGKYFTFTLSNDIFEDDFAENLDYEMMMAHNSAVLPDWLSFSGLRLKGTPPEEILGRDLELVLVAKNEFKESKVPFRLHVKISLAFWIQLILRYAPYILTIVGLLVSLNKILNILAKRRYKHPKEYYIRAGEEISPEVIQPILFVKEELKQSELIGKYVKKNWEEFIDDSSGILNKQRIIEVIQGIIQEMPLKEKERMSRYSSPIIDQLVINKFVLMQLDSDVKTKSLFEKLKPKCLEIVERDSQASSGFTINQNKLDKMLIPSGEREHSEDNLEESLIPTIPGVNIHLLKDAILAFVFNKHQLNISPVDVEIEVKQQVKSRFLFRFLKWNLKNIYLNDKNKIDYGINYRIIDDQLCFYGVTQNYFKGKTLVVQVKNRKHRIKKEIWIHGVSSDFQRDSLQRATTRTQKESRRL